jgi:hypothetical protein
MRGLFLLLSMALAACAEDPVEPETVDEFAARVGTGTDNGTGTGNATGTADGSSASQSPASPAQTASAGGVSAPAGTQGDGQVGGTGPNAGGSVLQLQNLGDISEVDLGPRAGGCTFNSAGTDMLVAAAPADRALPGKATVRAAGALYVLDAPPGGFDAVKAGTVFKGEGFSALVSVGGVSPAGASPAGAAQAKLTITNSEGQQSVFDGSWVCS